MMISKLYSSSPDRLGFPFLQEFFLHSLAYIHNHSFHSFIHAANTFQVLGVLGVEDIMENKSQGPCPDRVCILVGRDR